MKAPSRFAIVLSAAAAVAVALVILPTSSRAGGDCGPDTIRVTSHEDTVFVSHLHARKQQCLHLTVSTGYNVTDHLITFTEDDDGRPCPDFCCYNHLYSAAGFLAGHYLVQVYEAGSILYGAGEVDVTGSVDDPHMISIDQGQCLIPDPARETTWGLVRSLYR